MLLYPIAEMLKFAGCAKRSRMYACGMSPTGGEGCRYGAPELELVVLSV